jgi:hypothetical protein
VHVLRGRVRLSAGEQSWDGRSGDLLVVPDARHSLKTLEASAVLPRPRRPRPALERRRAQRAHHPSKRKPSAIGTDEDTVGLVRRLTAHYPDAKIAWILNWQGSKHAWHGREIPLEPARWPLIADGAHSAPACRST